MRYYNLDLLKIISIVFVITLHFFSHGRVLKVLSPNSIYWWAGSFTEFMAIVSVNCFVMITGYFSVTARFRVKKFIIFLMQVQFYSLLLFIIAYSLAVIIIDVKTILSVFFPIATRSYWFASIYSALYLLSPFINICIRNMDQRRMLQTITLMLLIFSIFPSLTFVENTWNLQHGYSLPWFVTLYFIAAYIRLYVYDINTGLPATIGKNISCSRKILCLAGYFLCTALLTVFRYSLPEILPNGLNSYELIWGYNSTVICFSSVCLFMFFLYSRIKWNLLNKMIKIFSPLVFGVYLVHEWPPLRVYLWNNVFAPTEYANTVFMFPYLILVILCIFTCGTAIDFIRETLFKYIENSALFTTICRLPIFNNILILTMEESLKKHE